jgi:hypothetical protein
LITRFIMCAVETQKPLQSLLKEGSLKFYSKSQVEKLPKPILVNRFLKDSGYLD